MNQIQISRFNTLMQHHYPRMQKKEAMISVIFFLSRSSLVLNITTKQIFIQSNGLDKKTENDYPITFLP